MPPPLKRTTSFANLADPAKATARPAQAQAQSRSTEAIVADVFAEFAPALTEVDEWLDADDGVHVAEAAEEGEGEGKEENDGGENAAGSRSTTPTPRTRAVTTTLSSYSTPAARRWTLAPRVRHYTPLAPVGSAEDDPREQSAPRPWLEMKRFKDQEGKGFMPGYLAREKYRGAWGDKARRYSGGREDGAERGG